MVEASGLIKKYRLGEQTIAALDRVDLKIAAGEFLCIMGRSGSGKSTLLNIFGALDRADQGHVKIDGQDLLRLSDGELAAFRRRRIGFIFQFFNLMPTLTAAENVALPLLLDGVSAERAKARATELLEKFELGDRQHHRPGQLSGGQMQRVAIARALAAKPALLLADEPTGNLDSSIGQQILGILKDLSEREGQTIVLVTHDQGAARFARRLVQMKDGRIASDEKA